MKKLTCILMLSVTIASANPERTVDLPGGPTMDFVWIEPGPSPWAHQSRSQNGMGMKGRSTR